MFPCELGEGLNLSYLSCSDASLTSHHSCVQDKKEEKGTALLGLTLRGMQVYQVRACVCECVIKAQYVCQHMLTRT